MNYSQNVRFPTDDSGWTTILRGEARLRLVQDEAGKPRHIVVEALTVETLDRAVRFVQAWVSSVTTIDPEVGTETKPVIERPAQPEKGPSMPLEPGVTLQTLQALCAERINQGVDETLPVIMEGPPNRIDNLSEGFTNEDGTAVSDVEDSKFSVPCVIARSAGA